MREGRERQYGRMKEDWVMGAVDDQDENPRDIRSCSIFEFVSFLSCLMCHLISVTCQSW